jgi:hypothetical protein
MCSSCSGDYEDPEVTNDPEQTDEDLKQLYASAVSTLFVHCEANSCESKPLA